MWSRSTQPHKPSRTASQQPPDPDYDGHHERRLVLWGGAASNDERIPFPRLSLYHIGPHLPQRGSEPCPRPQLRVLHPARSPVGRLYRPIRTSPASPRPDYAEFRGPLGRHRPRTSGRGRGPRPRFFHPVWSILSCLVYCSYCCASGPFTGQRRCGCGGDVGDKLPPPC